MKLLTVLGMATANSFRSKLRTTLTVIAIFIGAFTLTITTAIGTGVSDYISTQVAALGDSDTLSVSRASTGSEFENAGPQLYDPDDATGEGALGLSDALTDSDIEAIAEVDGILEARPLVFVSPSYVCFDGGQKYQLSAVPGADSGPELIAGEGFVGDGSYELLLPSDYLEALGLGKAEDAIGQTVTLGMPDYDGFMHEIDVQVRGILAESLFGAGAILNDTLTDELAAIDASGRPDSLNQGYYAATATFDPDLSEAELGALKGRLFEAGYIGQTVADSLGSAQTVITGIIAVLSAFAVIALIAAGFGIVNTLLMSVQERTREIGLMKAMGMSNGKVFALFSGEAIFIGFLGSALGAAAAFGLGTVASNVLADTALSGLEGLRVMQFAPIPVASIIVAVMVIAFVAGTLPARRAARQSPIDALRYE